MKRVPRPSLEELEAEILRCKKKKAYYRALRSTACIFIIVAAVAVLCSSFLFSVLEIQGGSMEPTLQEGQMVLALKTASFESGDVIAFYYNNKILLKRVIGGPGQLVDIHEDGSVYVDYVLLDEPYTADKAYGQSDISFPYQVQDKRWFVLGDHRSVSLDSRSELVGTVSQEQLVGRVLWCIWPLESFGPVK